MNRKFAVIAAALVPAVSFAAIPETVSTAIGTAGTDGSGVAALVIGALVLLFGFSLMKKALGR